jgi:hypothetical protein
MSAVKHGHLVAAAGLATLCLGGLTACGGPEETAGPGGLEAALHDRPDSSLLLPLHPPPYGQEYGVWAARWWQWAFSIPFPDNPLFDETGAKCGEDQSGPVFFLAGVFNASGTATRDCAVPAGKALFFPILNFEDDRFFPPNDMTIGQLRAVAASFMDDGANLVLEIDGVSLTVPAFRVQSPVFSVTLPDNNFEQQFGFAAPAGTYSPFVDDGFYAMVKPLPPGDHTVHFHGEVPMVSFTLDITYHLHVGP